MTTPPSPPETSRLKLGSFTVTVVKDGSSIIEKPWEIFGANQPPEIVRQLLLENFLPTDRFVNTYMPTIVDTGAEVVLVDTGFGAPMRGRGSGLLMAGLAAAGYAPEDITLVVLTHLHGDHIGGLVDNGVPAFPNARYVAGETEFAFWTDKSREGTPAEGGHRLVMSNVAPLAGKTTFIKDGDTVIGGITAIGAPGHTPGHLAFHIESDGKRLVMTGDAVNHYVLSLQRPDWEVRFDMDKAEAARTRRRLLGMISAERIAFLGYHMPFPAVGFVESHETGFRYVPKTYQFDL